MSPQELRKAREARGMTLREVADATGVPITYISVMENAEANGTLEAFYRANPVAHPPAGLGQAIYEKHMRNLEAWEARR